MKNFFKVRFYIYYKLNLQPSELEALPYYEYYWICQELMELMEEERKSNENQQEQSNSMMKNVKTPNINTKNLQPPKMK